MITPAQQQQIDAYKQANGMPTATGKSTFDLVDQQLQTMGGPKETTGVGKSISDYFGRVGSALTEDVKSGAEAVTKGAEMMQSGQPVAGAIHSGLGTAGAVARGIFSPLTEAIAPLIEPLVKRAASSEGGQELMQHLEDFTQKHPEAAYDLKNIVDIGGAGMGGAGVKAGTEAIAEAAPKVLSEAKEAVVGTAEEQAQEAAQKTISALDPTLKGKQLVTAYKQVATGGRQLEKAGIRTEQGLSPSEQSVRVGTRLSNAGINLTGNATKDIETLGTALDDTESNLQAALKGDDPALQYSADKPSLGKNLSDLVKKMPQEFAAIKDSSNLFKQVVTFAQSKLSTTKDTIEGLRDGRIAFDAQAKKEFPSAFKTDGMIDTKTPAGRAIKAVRDTWNEHLYNTAPEGSQIKALVGREADIFRAIDGVAPKAAALHGKTAVSQLITKHPTIAKYLGYGLAGIGAEKVLKGVGVPIP